MSQKRRIQEEALAIRQRVRERRAYWCDVRDDSDDKVAAAKHALAQAERKLEEVKKDNGQTHVQFHLEMEKLRVEEAKAEGLLIAAEMVE